MNHHAKLLLAVGAGAVGLVVLHAILHGQSAAASAVQVGATITAPFALTQTGGQVTNAVDATSSGVSSTPTTPITSGDLAAAGAAATPNPPPGIDPTGWSAALTGMHDIGAGTPPWSDPRITGQPYLVKSGTV